MVPRVLSSILAAAAVTVLLPAALFAQDMDKLKPAVVRVRSTQGELGAGFIVGIQKGLIYIVTASHVVAGDEKLEVVLYSNQQGDALPARLVLREYDNPKGLALLTINPKDPKLVSTLPSLIFADTSPVSGGESVKIIGFPDGTPFWTVSNGTVARVEGNNLIFAGPVRGGNSGGPVISSNGKVLGLVIDTLESQEVSAAAKAEIIISYVNGLVPKLVTLSNSSDNKQDDIEPSDAFCSTLNELLEASKSGFYSVVGKPSTVTNTFYPKIMMPGAVGGWVIPKTRFYNYMLIDKNKGNVESEFYSLVSKVKKCLPQWEESEESTPTDFYHHFRNSKEKLQVDVYYTPYSQHENYFLTLAVEIPK